MLAWLEVPVKSRYDVGTLVNVNLSLWLVSILLVPRLETDTCQCAVVAMDNFQV